jgi:hypothetical protein
MGTSRAPEAGRLPSGLKASAHTMLLNVIINSGQMHKFTSEVQVKSQPECIDCAPGSSQLLLLFALNPFYKFHVKGRIFLINPS